MTIINIIDYKIFLLLCTFNGKIKLDSENCAKECKIQRNFAIKNKDVIRAKNNKAEKIKEK